MLHPPRDRPANEGDPQLLARYARTRDPALRQDLVERYLPLARFAAARYANSSEPFDDLQQVASIGLLNAIDRYDPDNGSAFSSFALPTMHGELRRHFRDRSWAVRPPRTLQENALKVAKSIDELERRQRRTPTVEEVAADAGLTPAKVLEAREALGARHASSLSITVEPDGEASEFERGHGVIDEGYAGAEARATLAALSAGALTRREREIMRLRFEEDYTQAEIGAVVGLSQMHVSRVLRLALGKLRHVASQPVTA
jgi:RNA polymerase sigma-B factor